MSEFDWSWEPDQYDKIFEWGFDTTHFGNADAWFELLQEFDLPCDAMLPPRPICGWHWQNTFLLVVTAYNPLTGEHWGPYQRNTEGLAGYIGIACTDQYILGALVERIREFGPKDESSNEREYI